MSDAYPPHVLHAAEVFQIQGAVFEVNRVMGRGFLEAVYQECLALEFARGTSPSEKLPNSS